MIHRHVDEYLLFCAETLEQFDKPQAAVRLYKLLAAADPKEFKRIKDEALRPLNAAE